MTLVVMSGDNTSTADSTRSASFDAGHGNLNDWSRVKYEHNAALIGTLFNVHLDDPRAASSSSQSTPQRYVGSESSGSEEDIERSGDMRLVAAIEDAQLVGDLPTEPEAHSAVNVLLSCHGLVLSDGKDVRQRYPLKSIYQSITYRDDNDRWHVVFKVKPDHQATYTCLLLQCVDRDAAESICASLEALFNLTTEHSTERQN